MSRIPRGQKKVEYIRKYGEEKWHLKIRYSNKGLRTPEALEAQRLYDHLKIEKLSEEGDNTKILKRETEQIEDDGIKGRQLTQRLFRKKKSLNTNHAPANNSEKLKLHRLHNSLLVEKLKIKYVVSLTGPDIISHIDFFAEDFKNLKRMTVFERDIRNYFGIVSRLFDSESFDHTISKDNFNIFNSSFGKIKIIKGNILQRWDFLSAPINKCSIDYLDLDFTSYLDDQMILYIIALLYNNLKYLNSKFGLSMCFAKPSRGWRGQEDIDKIKDKIKSEFSIISYRTDFYKNPGAHHEMIYATFILQKRYSNES